MGGDGARRARRPIGIALALSVTLAGCASTTEPAIVGAADAPLAASSEPAEGYGARILRIVGAEVDWEPSRPMTIAKLAPSVFEEFPAIDRSGRVIAIVRSERSSTPDNEAQRVRFVNVATHATLASFVVFDEPRDMFTNDGDPLERAARERTNKKARAAAQALLDRSTWRALNGNGLDPPSPLENPWAGLDRLRELTGDHAEYVRFADEGVELEMRFAADPTSRFDSFRLRRRRGDELVTNELPIVDFPYLGSAEDGGGCGLATGFERAWLTPDRAHVLVAYAWRRPHSRCDERAEIDAMTIVDLPP
ncbi:MAG: hypothetical protein U0414_30925 [Polyangiaceae bacterium]